MASLQVKDIVEDRDSGLGTISKTSAASTDDMSIINSGSRSEVSDEFQVRKGLNDELRVSFHFPYQPVVGVSGQVVGHSEGMVLRYLLIKFSIVVYL